MMCVCFAIVCSAQITTPTLVCPDPLPVTLGIWPYAQCQVRRIGVVVCGTGSLGFGADWRTNGGAGGFNFARSARISYDGVERIV